MLAAQFLCLPFADLTTTQLYALLRLRSEVFVVEQVCPFQDMDNCDQQALHVLGYRGEELLCYARLLPRGSKYDAVSIGRVVSAASVRRDGATAHRGRRGGHVGAEWMLRGGAALVAARAPESAPLPLCECTCEHRGGARRHAYRWAILDS